MALNKYMHPKNIYRTPPDFKDLAIKYSEFREYANQVSLIQFKYNA